MNVSGKNETIYLKHVEDILKRKTNRAELLLNQFKSANNLDSITITRDSVYDLVSNLQNNKAASPDALTHEIIKGGGKVIS